MEENPKWEAACKPVKEMTLGAQQSSKQQLRRTWKDQCGSAIYIALFVLSIGVCVVVFVRISELQSRILSLEQQQRDAQLSSWMRSLEQVEPVILGRLDQILEEVSAFTCM